MTVTIPENVEEPVRETEVDRLETNGFDRMSMMYTLIGNHQKGIDTDLGSLQQEYTTLHRDGSTFV